MCKCTLAPLYYNKKDFWGALGYYNGYVVTRNADYNHIGETGLLITNSDYVASSNDQNWAYISNSERATNNSYLMKKYTKKNSSNNAYPARAISNQINYYNIQLTSSAEVYYLPDGYKGTGNILYSGTVTKSDKAYTFIIPKEKLKTLSDDYYEIPITFKAYSGSGENFEGSGREYSNYRVSVEAGMLETVDGSYLSFSNDTDWVVYTNARLISDVITP